MTALFLPDQWRDECSRI